MLHGAQPEDSYADQDAQPCLEADLHPHCDGAGKVEAGQKPGSVKGNLAANCPLLFSFALHQEAAARCTNSSPC